MTNKITLEEALELVSFFQKTDGTWHVHSVYGDVASNVLGSVRNVYGDVKADVYGDVKGYVGGSVGRKVGGTIGGREWQFVET